MSVSEFSQQTKKIVESVKTPRVTRDRADWLDFRSMFSTTEKSVRKTLFTAQRNVRTKLGNYQLCRLNEFEIPRTFPTENCAIDELKHRQNCLKIL